jgi:hypothetical protein
MQKATLSELEVQKLKDWFRKLAPEHYDKVDLHSEIDRSLSLTENQRLLREKYRQLIPESMKEQAKEAKAHQERILQENIKKAEEEVAAWNESVKYVENADLDAFYKPIHRAINKLCKGYSTLVFIKGRGGIGKSRNIRRMLHKNKADFIEVTGEVTEAFLYRLIYENNEKIIWLKDITKLLNGLGSVNLLKAATETEATRVLTKSNYSKQQADLPDRFICKAKFVFDYNNLYGQALREDFEALQTRGDFIEVSMCDDEVIEIMKIIASTPDEKKVTDFLINQFKNLSVVRLNLRMQQKAFQTFKYAVENELNWEEEIGHELEIVSKTRAMLYSLIGNKAVKKSELKKLLVKQEIVSSLKAADTKINEWLYTEELFRLSDEENFPVCILDIRKEKLQTLS